MASNTSVSSSAKNRGFHLPVCPISLVVFITTVILVTRQKQQQMKCTITVNDEDEDDDDPSTTDTVPINVVFVLGPPGVGM